MRNLILWAIILAVIAITLPHQSDKMWFGLACFSIGVSLCRVCAEGGKLMERRVNARADREASA